MAERLAGSQEVVGSSPIRSIFMTIKFLDKFVRWEQKERPEWLRDFSIVVLPPIFLFLVLGTAIFFQNDLGKIIKITEITSSPLNFYLGIPVFVLGAFLYTWTILLFAKFGGGTQTPLMPTQKLVIRGPYKYSRNPMVSGVILFIVGFGLILNSLPFIAAGLIIPLPYLVLIKLVEEKELEIRFGNEYSEYKKKTPFIFPRFWRYGGFA